ncbi:MAG: glycolate oxidase subunit GlcE [Chromatiales bacterium]|jgi:glycolate oxidase FAD binding subunit|nr:glycolate oxidase subunit GlcE [Chromatiales bacterium]
MNDDRSDALREAVIGACEKRAPLCIRGGGSKNFYGRTPQGELLDVAHHRGIISYEPTELTITARCGTTLATIEKTLAANNQMLAFEPPSYAPSATIGGTVATALAGPRRPYAGSVRDFLLGIRCINGEGKLLRFGGEVMKNVAGFDTFRLMAGAMGTLGVLLEVTFKVLPKPAHARTLIFECDVAQAIALMNRWAGRALPLSATAFDGKHLYARIEGSSAALDAAERVLGGEIDAHGEEFWTSVREQQHAWFQRLDGPLWRISVPSATPPLPIVGSWFIEWGGAQRWLRTALAPKFIREMCARSGGHATLFRSGDHSGSVFQPLTPALLRIHRNLKQAFDPHGILNPQRMYRDI